MIPAIGLIVATYAVTRLVQVPIESASLTKEGAVSVKTLALTISSIVGIIAIATLAFALTGQGAPVEKEPPPIRTGYER